MSTKKKLLRLCFPAAVVAFGVYLIFAKRAAYGVLWPNAQGPVVVIAGVLLCLLGVLGVFGTVREFARRSEDSLQGQSGRKSE